MVEHASRTQGGIPGGRDGGQSDLLQAAGPGGIGRLPSAPRAAGGLWGSVVVAALVGVPLLFGPRLHLPAALKAASLVVSSSRAQQMTDGSKRVEFLYDLTGAPASGAAISLKVSADGGSTYSIVPAASTLSGDVGPGIQNGTNRRIVWNAAATLPAGTFSNLFKGSITATAEECTVTCTATAPGSAAVGQAVSFAATATPSSCSGAVTYLWGFGDGATSTQQNPAKTYGAAGTFGWTMTATAAADGVSCTRSGTITVAAAGGQEITVTLPGGVPLVMVRIPAGTFQMGSPTTEQNRWSDETLHQVTLRQDYYVAKTEVTQGQWKAVMGTAMTTDCGSHGVGDSYPVYCVSWTDVAGAGGFLEKLNAHLTSTAQAGAGKCRLPTEAEWERAARGGTQTRFSFGDALDSDDQCGASVTADPYLWWCANSGSGSHVVATKRANQYGLYDMHGNVWEWVNDWYDVYPSSPKTDPTGPTSGSFRVVRGGGWFINLQLARSAIRDYVDPGLRNFNLGFRPARSL